MSVGSKRIECIGGDSTSNVAYKGNMIIASGTLITTLPKKFYTKIGVRSGSTYKMRTCKRPI